MKKVKKCVNCGNVSEEADKFCIACGVSLTNATVIEINDGKPTPPRLPSDDDGEGTVIADADILRTDVLPDDGKAEAAQKAEKKSNRRKVAITVAAVVFGLVIWTVIGFSVRHVYKGYTTSSSVPTTEAKVADAKPTDAKVEKSAEPAIEPIKKADAKPVETKPADKPAEPVKVAAAKPAEPTPYEKCVRGYTDSVGKSLFEEDKVYPKDDDPCAGYK